MGFEVDFAEQYIENSKSLLFKRWHTAGDLRREFSYMAADLIGEFALEDSGKPKFNVYENGKVVSRDLVQFVIPPLKKNPTVGFILPGEYHFPTGSNTETLKVLDGQLEAWVNNGPISILMRDGTIEAPAETILHLGVATKPCFYICRYTPKPRVEIDTHDNREE